MLAVSGQTGRGVGTLRAALEQAAADLLDAHALRFLGRERATVRDRLRQRLADGHRTTTRAEFAQVCDGCGVTSDRDELLRFLNDTGVVIYRPERCGDRVILDKAWALAAIYTVLDRDRVLPLLRDDGRFTRSQLGHLAWQGHTADEQNLFLELMEACDICFRVGERRVGGITEPEYVAPELLPEDADTIDRVLGPSMPAEPPMCAATARFRYLHDGARRAVLARVGRQFRSWAAYWKWGAFLFDRRTDTRARIDMTPISTPLGRRRSSPPASCPWSSTTSRSTPGATGRGGGSTGRPNTTRSTKSATSSARGTGTCTSVSSGGGKKWATCS